MRAKSIQSVVAAALFAAGMVAVPASTQAASVHVYVAPPAPIVETVPPPRAGYVWAPGYYRWNGHRHVWANGHYVAARPGHHYVGSRWEQRGDRYYFHDGYWARG